MHAANEPLRKSIHIAFGLFAFTLNLIPWWAAAGVAGVAVLGNWLVLHRVVGKRVSRHERGFDAGIVLYPFMVLLLILVFRNAIHFAAIGWAFLAFGDGVASLAGKAVRIASLPWNRDKSWGGLLAFFVAASASGVAVGYWLGYRHPWVIVLAALVAAVVESLPLGVDDNVTVPVAAAVALAVLAIPTIAPFWRWPYTVPWLIVNGVLALVGYFTKSVNVSGALGGWFLGAILILGAGWELYVALLVFFVIGTLTTKLGYQRKARLGLAQEEGGRRGFSHAFSNVGVAAICAIATQQLARSRWSTYGLTEYVTMLMGITSLATAAADTAASEIGQLFGRRAFLPLTLKRVPVGTEGAISVEGTVGGAMAGLLVPLITFAVAEREPFHFRFSWPMVITIAACAFLGSYLESIAGSWNRKQGSVVPNGVLNFFNTAAGALLFYYAAAILGLRSQF